MWSYYYSFHARNFILLISAGDRLATSSVRQQLSYSFEKLYSSTPHQLSYTKCSASSMVGYCCSVVDGIFDEYFFAFIYYIYMKIFIGVYSYFSIV